MAEKTTGQWVGTIVGAVVGYFTGGTGYILTGAALGGAAGAAIDPPKGPHLVGPRLSDLSQQTATYGAGIPRIYGNVAVSGNVFWIENNALKEVSSTESSGGKGGGGGAESTTYAYYATFAVGLCQGPIAGVRRIWIGSKLFYDAGSSDIGTIMASNQAAGLFTLHLGTEDQMPDDRMQASLGVANTPAYRGLAYIVFNDLPLKDHGNSLLGAPVKVEVMNVSSLTSAASHHGLPVYGTWNSVAASESMVMAIEQSLGLGQTAAVTRDGVNWQKSTLPVGASWYVLCSGGGETFLAIGDTSNFALTTNGGRTWINTVVAGSSYSFDDVIWNGSLYVAIKYGNSFFTSENGIVWYSRGLPITGQWKSIAWSGSVFCAVAQASTNQCVTSPDGITWTAQTLPRVAVWDDIAWNGSVFCAIASASDYVALSSDGISWAEYLTPGGVANKAIAWNGEFFCIVGQGSNDAKISRDGITWSIVALAGMQLYRSLCSFNGVFIGTANNSSNALTLAIHSQTAYGTLADVIEAEVLSSNLLTAPDVDVSQLTQQIRGYRVASVGAIRSAIDPLQAAFPFDVVQAGYKIKFKPRGSASVATVSAVELDARAGGEKPGVAIVNAREMDSILPRRVSLKYLDLDREYDIGEQYAERLNTDAINISSLDMPLVMNSTEAAGNAEMLLYLYWLERYDITFSLPPSYARLEPGDVITVNATEGTYSLRLTSINYLSDGRLECSAKYNSSAIYSPTAIGEPGLSTGAGLTLLGDTRFALLDIPLLLDATDMPGFPAALCGCLSGWPGGILSRTDDSGQTWTTIQGFTAPGAVIGLASNTIGAGRFDLIDKASALAVNLSSGALSSVTEAQMLGGANHFAYGAHGRWEIIAAQTCTLQGDGSYVLTNLLRGRFGTEWAAGLHAIGDDVVHLDSNKLAFITSNLNSIGVARTYRAVTAGGSPSSAGQESFTYTGVNLECLSPVYLNGSRHPSTNDWSLEWLRRTRVGGEWRDYVDATLGETAQSYEVEIYSSAAYTVLKRTISGLTAPAATYTSANQVTDFGSNQATLYVKIYQLSANVGRGYPLTTSITR